MERASVATGVTICVLLALWLPSAFGVVGLTPQLGLVYSSGVAQSIAGVGWCG